MTFVKIKKDLNIEQKVTPWLSERGVRVPSDGRCVHRGAVCLTKTLAATESEAAVFIAASAALGVVTLPSRTGEHRFVCYMLTAASRPAAAHHPLYGLATQAPTSSYSATLAPRPPFRAWRRSAAKSAPCQAGKREKWLTRHLSDSLSTLEVNRGVLNN